ncbi:hypothetical protein SRRS_30820 [Sporomusa rhizae]|uniref:hypothetical protein n=1 Tax=Sporomusa rhizae TaxID=357999 RepID=UPI00352AD109
MNAPLRISIALCTLLIIAQGLSLAGIVFRGNHDFVYNIIGNTVFWVVYSVFAYIYRIRINYYIQVAVVIAIIGDGFLGFFLNLYVLSPTYDRVQHIFSTYAISLFLYSIVTFFMKKTIEIQWIRFVIVAALGMAAGSLYEIIEFAADTIMKPQILNQPSLQDTDLDLISNTIGAIIAGIHSMRQSFSYQRK